MKKFENKINKETLKNALINWVLGTDGNDGATECIMDEIPWTEDMGYKFWREKVYDKIDEAIGSRCDNGKDWVVAKLVEYADSYIENTNYRRRFYFFIDKKVNDIYNTYQKCIDELNEYLEKKADKKIYRWKMVNDCGFKESEKTFNTHEECYEDMRKAVNDKVLWNIEYTDFADEDEKIDINIRASLDKIVVESYSGTYTWTVEKI